MQHFFFQNDFAPFSSVDNKIFKIFSPNKIEKFEELTINFHAKYENSQMPPITGIKFNEVQICPDEMEMNGCARFEMLSNGTGGRWDGRLIINPKQLGNELKIDLEFDEFSLALGVS